MQLSLATSETMMGFDMRIVLLDEGDARQRETAKELYQSIIDGSKV
jgi:hypothetical protein